MHNLQHPDNMKSGPLSAEDTEEQQLFWTKRAERDMSQFAKEELKLNLQKNEQEILKCRGRIQCEYQVFLPDTYPYTKKLVKQAHLDALNGGVGLTMAKVRDAH